MTVKPTCFDLSERVVRGDKQCLKVDVTPYIDPLIIWEKMASIKFALNDKPVGESSVNITHGMDWKVEFDIGNGWAFYLNFMNPHGGKEGCWVYLTNTGDDDVRAVKRMNLKPWSKNQSFTLVFTFDKFDNPKCLTDRNVVPVEFDVS
jgi:hypothetical protein